MANNGKTSSSLSNKILDAFEILAQAEVSSAQFDKTITGIIISCEDEATGRYKVQYQDAIFYAYSSALDVTYNKGVSVQVKIPNNDWSGRKIIIGTVEENGIDYGTIVEDPLLRYEYIGIDCISSTEQNDLSSYWDEDKNSDIEEDGIGHFNITVYDKDRDIDLIDLNETMIYDNIKQGNSVLLGATIKTDIPDVQRFKGDYGIKYTLTFNDIANVEATVDRYYIIDIDKMSGEPYSFDKATDQIIPFDIDSDNFLYVKKIELFTKNFIYQDNIKPADIFISNLRFQAAYRIPDEEFAGTALSIITPEGNYFIESEGKTSKQAIAQLRIKGKITDSTTKKMQYYWFIEDLRVNKTNDVGYHKYGGRGWKCLNEYNVTEGTDEDPITVDYVSGKDTFIIKKDNSKSKATKYKCVVNYNNQVLEKEFSFVNYDIKDEVYILADRDPNFTNSIGATTLTCVATNGVTYQWAKIDAEGGFEALRDTAAENKEYENAVEEYNNLQTAIEKQEKPNNENNQALLKYYQDIIQSYNYKERRKENQIINLQAGSIFQEATYKCQAFDSAGNSLGIASQLVTNYLSAGEDLQTGSLIINNGSQVFKYNAKGIAPTSEQFEEPQVILPLTFTLRNVEGIEIPMDALRDTDITWTVPIKNTMIRNYLGNVVSHDEDLGIEIYNGKSLSYTINENYYTNKDNNEIELQVRYQGLVYVAKTNLYFIKDGENGTNGTEYVLKILPSTDTIGRLKTVTTTSESEANWLRIQLWYNGIKIYEGDKNNDGSNVATGKPVTVTWEMLGELNTDYGLTHNVMVQSNGDNNPTWTAKNSYDITGVDIVKAIVEYDGMRIVATAPIIYSSDWDTKNYNVSLKEGTGFTHVVYSEDGLTPNYNSHTPFEIAIHKKIAGDWGDITGHTSLTYHWTTIGNLKIKSGYEDVDENNKPLGYSTLTQVMFEPVGKYNSEANNNSIVCTIKDDTTVVGTFYIPVHFLLNTYGNTALNEWDGNSIKLDANGNTMLLAPQGGFGKKEDDNSYTGVLLGTVKDYTNSGLEHTGIFGYKAGTRTMFLNSENGAAIFGKVGQDGSQIVIDPNSDIGRLYTNKFYKNYDTKTGLPLNYDDSNESGEGALIDLTTPQIRWGNGNFKVTKEGYITARGGGTIAGWNIDDTALFTETKNDNTNVQIASSNFTRTINGTQRTDWRMAFSNNFGVSSEGIMHAASGIIGSGTNKIILGQSTGDSARSAIYNNKSAFNSTNSGFYVGTDGIALGAYSSSTGNSAFQVTSAGVLTARSGYIGNGSSGWTIGNTNLYNGKTKIRNTDDTEETGVYIGTNGFGLGKTVNYGTAASPNWHSAFEVSSSGVLYANNGTFKGKITSTSGQIGGWTIGTDRLTGGNITLNSNGSLSGGDTYAWSITKDGTATFNKINAKGATIEGTITATSGSFSNCTINGSCTIGGERVDGAFVKNANVAANAITSGKIADAAITTAKIAAAAITEAKIADAAITNAKIADATITSAKISSLSASKITAGTMSASSIVIKTGSGSLSCGTNTNHPSVTGLNVGSYGVAMGGNEISSCGTINFSSGASLTSDGTIYVSAAEFDVTGGATIDSLTVTGASSFGSVNFTNGIQVGGTSGKTTTIAVDLAHYRTFVFKHGILVDDY